VFAVRAKHDSEVARNAAAPAPAPALAAPTDQTAIDATAPAQSAATQASTDQTATASSPPPAVPPEVVSTPVAPSSPTSSNVAKNDAGTQPTDESKSAKAKAADRRIAKTRNTDDTTGTRVASAAPSNTRSADGSASNGSDSVKSNNVPAPSSNDVTSSVTAGALAETQQAPAQVGQETATSASPAAPSNEPIASDSQITTDVKSQIATAAPNSNVDVTTANGVVSLAGSVPSQDAVEQVRQAAERVAGVRHVDASALMVDNQ
jgi:osmotically-inducible protein OsmY